MTAFTYRNGQLHAEGVPLATIAEAVGTPVYVYSTAELTANYRRYADAFAGQDVHIHYALKANSNQAVIRTLARLGAGADVVSAGEMRRALAAGIAAKDIVFSGVGKTREEMAAAIEAGIGQINVESLPELEVLSEVAAARGATVDIAFRVNPDVDAKTHAKISTGKADNKFGVEYDRAREAFARAAALPGVRPVGIAVHIGSQLTDIAPYRAAYTRVAELARALRADGIGLDLIDLGGGLGVRYRPEDTPPDYAAYAAMVREVVGPLGCRLACEPGRSLVASAGVLLSRVVYHKPGSARSFLIVDAAMNDLLRPSLYDAFHPIRPVLEPGAGAEAAPIDIVGPVCESGDTFAKQRPLPPVADGELVVFDVAGAYGAVMASTYNTRPQVPEVLVDGDRYAVVRPRIEVEALIAQDKVPAWLE
ncbi:MAG TPA: diaminopimelate decarboxylase [Alphaproteobacteria bacterium]|nr:diaminopimelate decarboxylase [Alphaproteobacteria bacterium]